MIAQTLTSVRAKPRLRREEDAASHDRNSGHRSVMVEEALALLEIKKGDVVVDATLGLGGHTTAILKYAPQKLIALDADTAAIAQAKEHLGKRAAEVTIVEANFRDLGEVLKKERIETITKALFDLGWNRTQLASKRGFSFLEDEPLVMSYGAKPASGFTAAEILNSWEEKVIADVLFGYGEERYARRIAKAVVARRHLKPFETTIELVEVIRDAVPTGYRHGKLHFATKTFQALRIAVNDELGSIEKGIASAWNTLAPGGKIAVITFHSIEDRLVKRTFAALAKKDGTLLVKKPLIPSRSEIISNPSARSAKLRAIEKITA